MSHPPNIDFTGSIPALYDEFLGPAIFASYADDLTARINARVKSGRLLPGVADAVEAVTLALTKEGGGAPFRSTMVAVVGTARAA